jgi:hypothetical protein
MRNENKKINLINLNNIYKLKIILKKRIFIGLIVKKINYCNQENIKRRQYIYLKKYNETIKYKIN